MIQKFFFLVTMASVLLISTQALFANNNSQTQEISFPVVVELFTSQGCSSCPPADRILSSLAQNENIIALGCHVSYWNHLRWQDTLSQDFCDMRQHGYVGMKGEKRIYTPQMIVNGTHAFVGSHGEKVKSALEKSQNAPIQIIQVEVKNKKEIRFSLPETVQGSYRLWAYGYKKQHHQDIKSGENRGQSITYANPVLSYTNLGSWQGSAVTQTFQVPDAPIDAIAILAQEGGYAKIVAAGKVDF